MNLRVVVSKIVEETPSVKTLRLDLPDVTPRWFRPGQWVRLGFPAQEEPGRSYSISSSPLEKGFIEITFARVGAFSERLFNLKGAEELALSGPFGDWTFADEDLKSVLVASGTGISPMRSIIRYVLDKGLPNQLALHYAAATPRDLVFRRELEEFRRRGVEIRLTITAPEEMFEEDEPWDGPTGRVRTRNVLSGLGSDPAAAYYLCGSSKLTAPILAGLAKAGVDSARIRCETWGDF